MFVDSQIGAVQESLQCLKDCQECHDVCLRTAMNYCLKKGGKHVEPTHFRLMFNCAELCQTAAHFMLSDSPSHAVVCAACADVCEVCAKSCDELGGMEDCAQICRQSAESCREMISDVC